jgi:hypothetical protein
MGILFQIMNAFLLLTLIIIGNLCLYWVLFGKKRYDHKFKLDEKN